MSSLIKNIFYPFHLNISSLGFSVEEIAEILKYKPGHFSINDFNMKIKRQLKAEKNSS